MRLLYFILLLVLSVNVSWGYAYDAASYQVIDLELQNQHYDATTNLCNNHNECLQSYLQKKIQNGSFFTFIDFSNAAKGLLNPQTIRFSQDSIKATFRDGRSIQELVKGLKNGTIKASDIPAIRTVQRNGQLISIDNRRLAAFQQAGVAVRTRPATAQEIAQAVNQGKFSAGELGGATIRIRGQ